MPSTIQTILKPTRARALDTSGNNNHGQIYSGRALEFDGVVDYLDTGMAFSENTFTISCWIYMNSITSDRHIFDARDSGADGVRIMASNPSKLEFQLNDDSDNITSTLGYGLTWIRGVFTYDGTTQKIYINGQLDTSLVVSETFSVTTNAFIGARNFTSATNYFDGMLSDFQAWDTAWSASDALYDYLNPEQLALNRGGTSLTNSNLKLWYPMNDGHRGSQSYVLDASNTGLSDNIVVNGDFSAEDVETLTSGSQLTGWDVVSVGAGNTFSIVDGQVNMTITESGNAAYIKQQNVTTVGRTYKISFDVISQTGDVELVFEKSGGGGFYSTTTLGTHTFYFNADTTDFTFRKSGHTGTVVFDNCVCLPINAKNHATTAFYGDELVTRSTDRDFTASDGTVPSAGGGAGTWNAGSGNEITIASNTLKVNNAGAAASSANYPFTTVVGRSYNVKITLKTESSDIAKVVVGGNADGSNVIAQDTAIAADDVVNLTVVAAATTTYVTLMNTGTSEDDNTTWDDFSIKEVGTATGWTDADQQLDIPQTALQSYNQLAWFDGTADYISIADHNDFSFGDGSTTDSAFSVSGWVFPNEATKCRIITKQDEWLLTLNASDKPLFSLYDNSTSHQEQKVAANALTAGKWYHIVGTYDGTGGTSANAGMQLYVNGESVGTNTDAGTYAAMHNKSNAVLIGSFGTDSSFAEGCVTECSIWNKELSATEVTELYNSGLALDATTHSGSSNLIGYWRNNGFATWQDLTANNRDGTPTSITETMLITAGADSSRDSQGFLMNRQRLTNSLNLVTNTIADGIGDGERAVVPGRIALGTADFSISFWAYKHQDWMNQWVVGQFADDNNRWYIRAAEGNPPRLQIYVKSGGNTVMDGLDNTTSLDSYLETWIHVACVVDRSDDVKWYFNGSHIKTVAVESGQESASMTYDADLNIGWFAHTSFDDHHFNGQIDDLLIYSDKLEAPEVTRIYNAGKRSHR